MTGYGVDYVSKKILDIAKALDIIAPGYEAKVYWNNNANKYELTKENEIIMSKKSAQEIEFEQFEAQKRAEADAEVATFKADIDKEIEEKRRELREEQRQADANDKAAEFWYFYSGLLNNGFTEEQAMQILLAVANK